jgi:putative FmdB family regulatory protein
MPTYEYRCTECGEDLEVVQSFHDDPLTECPACGGKLRKVFSPIGISFKGSGFYRTDSRSSSSIPPGSKTSNGSSDASDKSSDKGSGDAGSDSDSSSSTAAAGSTSS